MEQKKTGRPSKGTRERVVTRVSPELAEALRAEAARRGMTVTDLLGLIVDFLTLGGMAATNEGGSSGI